MEVILREDIEKLGHRGQVVKVAPGYARNFLLPKKLAVSATEANKKIVAQERDAWLRREAKVKGDAEDLAKMLAGVSLTISQRAGEEGHLFGSVTAKDIADALEAQKYNIDRKKIVLEENIRQTGEHKVPIRLHREVTAEITVNVVAEE
jgi:large subunit ribosomal protein L9